MSACTFCGGAAHPATGCVYGPRTIACGPCVRSFWQWFRRHQHGPKDRPDFYESAARWSAEVRQAEARKAAADLLAIWGHMPNYRGTISLVKRLARLTLA